MPVRCGTPRSANAAASATGSWRAWPTATTSSLQAAPFVFIRRPRAALAGQPLTDYLLAEIRKVAEHPTAAELAERLSQRPPARLRTAPAKAVRAERDRR